MNRTSLAAVPLAATNLSFGWLFHQHGLLELTLLLVGVAVLVLCAGAGELRAGKD